LAILAILSQAISGLQALSCLIMDGVSIDLLLMVAGCPARLISKRDLFGRVFLVEGAAIFLFGQSAR